MSPRQHSTAVGTSAGGSRHHRHTGTSSGASGVVRDSRRVAQAAIRRRGAVRGQHGRRGARRQGPIPAPSSRPASAPSRCRSLCSAGKITDVTALQLTDADRKSVQISNRAAPLLRTEVLAAQSAEVKTISGATVTSNAYLTSLQAALDAANL